MRIMCVLAGLIVGSAANAAQAQVVESLPPSVCVNLDCNSPGEEPGGGGGSYPPPPPPPPFDSYNSDKPPPLPPLPFDVYPPSVDQYYDLDGVSI